MEPRWLEIARGDIGEAEISGPDCNPRIRQYFASAKIDDWAKDDTTVPWCAAALSFWMAGAGHEPPKGSARARAWLVWGDKLEVPELGCVVVLSRGKDINSGHVGLWVGEKDGRVLLLGGNQGDAVSVSGFRKDSVLGYRWPTGAPHARDVTPADLPASRIVSAGSAVKAAGGIAAAGGGAAKALEGLDWSAQVAAIGEQSKAAKHSLEAVHDLAGFAIGHWPVLLACAGLGIAVLGHKLQWWRAETAARVPYIGR